MLDILIRFRCHSALILPQNTFSTESFHFSFDIDAAGGSSLYFWLVGHAPAPRAKQLHLRFHFLGISVFLSLLASPLTITRHGDTILAANYWDYFHFAAKP